MAYAYGMRFDDNSNAITVIDEDNQTAVTTGYIDGDCSLTINPIG